jgi:hypothetical protein
MSISPRGLARTPLRGCEAGTGSRTRFSGMFQHELNL